MAKTRSVTWRVWHHDDIITCMPNDPWVLVMWQGHMVIKLWVLWLLERSNGHMVGLLQGIWRGPWLTLDPQIVWLLLYTYTLHNQDGHINSNELTLGFSSVAVSFKGSIYDHGHGVMELFGHIHTILKWNFGFGSHSTHHLFCYGYGYGSKSKPYSKLHG